ncbi:hypothetical protein [Clostridium sp.]|uniref:hypothetical protein n=1 Tax=Clostridium sp. TaxID=1506 RepID=UPI003217B173
MKLFVNILTLAVFIGSAIVSVWSLLKATKEYKKSETLKAIYYMLFSILFFLMNKLA